MTAGPHRYPGLSGRVALVTGANHGIGAAVAARLAADGAAVLLTYYRLEPGDGEGTPAAYGEARLRDAGGVVAAIRAAGGRAEAVEADLADPASAALLMDHAERSFGPVEILVNNASGWVADTFLLDDTDQFGRSLVAVTPASIGPNFAVDAWAPALLVAELARRHVRRDATWGRIIGLTSGGPNGFPGEVSYGAAKAAQENYVMSAARELARYGITANMVHPPVTDTGWVTEAVAAAVEASDELVHVAEPAEVAEVVAYLASDLGRLMSGNVLRLR